MTVVAEHGKLHKPMHPPRRLKQKLPHLILNLELLKNQIVKLSKLLLTKGFDTILLSMYSYLHNKPPLSLFMK